MPLCLSWEAVMRQLLITSWVLLPRIPLKIELWTTKPFHCWLESSLQQRSVSTLCCIIWSPFLECGTSTMKSWHLLYSCLFFFFFFFLFFWGCTWGIWKFSGAAAGPAAQPAPQQHGIRAMSVTYTIAHGNAGSPTHWVGPGIDTESSWILVRFITTEPWQELLDTPAFITMKVISCLNLKRDHRFFTGGIFQALALMLPWCVLDRRPGNSLWGLRVRVKACRLRSVVSVEPLNILNR